MDARRILLLALMCIVSIVAQRHRKHILVVGIINLGNASARTQANRYNDLYRELARQQIRDSVVRLVLVNEPVRTEHFPSQFYDKIRIYQDGPKDQLMKKLGQHGQQMNNLVFGRCGYLIFTQQAPRSNLNDADNYQELLRTITMAMKNKRRCQALCS